MKRVKWQFQPLILNRTGFDDDDDYCDEDYSNERVDKNLNTMPSRSSAQIGLPCYLGVALHLMDV